MNKDRLENIFGGNLLEDITQISGYEELTGLSGHKPWDCVGTAEESALAFLILNNSPEWRENAIVKDLSNKLKTSKKISDSKIDKVKQRIMNIADSNEHNLPKKYEKFLYEYIEQNIE